MQQLIMLRYDVLCFWIFFDYIVQYNEPVYFHM